MQGYGSGSVFYINAKQSFAWSQNGRNQFGISSLQSWPCPFASSPFAIENSTWLRKSASDEFSGEDTNQLSHNTPAGVPCQTMICHVISRLARAWAVPISVSIP